MGEHELTVEERAYYRRWLESLQPPFAFRHLVLWALFGLAMAYVTFHGASDILQPADQVPAGLLNPCAGVRSPTLDDPGGLEAYQACLYEALAHGHDVQPFIDAEDRSSTDFVMLFIAAPLLLSSCWEVFKELGRWRNGSATRQTRRALEALVGP